MIASKAVRLCSGLTLGIAIGAVLGAAGIAVSETAYRKPRPDFDKFPRYFATLADAIAATDLEDGQIVITGSHSGEGGGGRYKFQEVGDEADDGIFSRDATAGGELDLINRAVANVMQAGAVGDGSTDDTAALQAAITAGAGATVSITGGKFVASGGALTIPNNTTIVGDEQSELILLNATLGAAAANQVGIVIDGVQMSVDATSSTNVNAISLGGTAGNLGSDLAVRNCYIDGNETEGAAAIGITYAEDYEVRNNKLIDWSDENAGIVVQDTRRGKIHQNEIRNVARSAIMIYQTNDDIVVSENTVYQWMMRRDTLDDGAIDCYGPNCTNINIVDNILDTGTMATAGTGLHKALRFCGVHRGRMSGNKVTMRSPDQSYVLECQYRDGVYSEQIIVSENQFVVHDSVAQVIRLTATDDVQVINNTLECDDACDSFVVSNGAITGLLEIAGNNVQGNSNINYLFRNTGGAVLVMIHDNHCTGFDSLLCASNTLDIADFVCANNYYETASTSYAIYLYPTWDRVTIAGNTLITAGGNPIDNLDVFSEQWSIGDNLLYDGSKWYNKPGDAITVTTGGARLRPWSDHTVVTSHGASRIAILPQPTPGRVVTGSVASTGFEMYASGPLIDSQDESDYAGDITGGTGYTATDEIVMADGTTITVDAVSGGAVTQFTVDTSTAVEPVWEGRSLTQSSTNGGGTGFALAVAADNVTDVSINGVVCSDTNEAAIAANHTFRAVCTSETTWVVTTTTSAGAAGSTVTPDAR